MNKRETRNGPNLGLLLLIPAALIIAKAGRHRREMMMEHGWSGPGGPGNHGDLGPRAFRLPPRIESALDAWHTRVHQASDPIKPAPSLEEG